MYCNWLSYLIFLSIFVQQVYQQNPLLKKSYDYNKYLATKTAYRNIAYKDATPIKFQGCEPIKTWMVIRHGTRYPSMRYINGMINKLPDIKEQIIRSAPNLTYEELIRLHNWKSSVIELDEKNLAHEGEEEMIDLAERMQLRFPNILPNIYSNTSYKFRYTATQRTKESARFFSVGLFGRPTSTSVWYPEPSTKDPILRFYKLCEKWKNEIKRNPEAMIERAQFIEGPYMENVIKEINLRLNGKYNFEDILLMYMTCAFETSWQKYKVSPWCSIFSTEALKVMEYQEDLQYYWIDGYGYNLTHLQACPAIQNLVQFFQMEEVYPKAVLYFTHSGTLLKLLAHLGLYKDELPLKHDNYMEQTDRLWKVSKIDAFGTNLAFILYRCGNSKKILLLHQEKPIRLPGCLDTDLCDFNTFMNTFNNSINNCHFNEMCHLN